MIASLGMYDLIKAQHANDNLWALIRDRLRSHGQAAPDALTRGPGAYWDAWTASDLVLSQTCGFPYRAKLHGKVSLIGTPDFGVAGCPPGYYRSVFVARISDPRAVLTEFDDADLAFNEDLSHSGWAAPQNHATSIGIKLRPHLWTGGHLLSARAVAEGRADIAAIDAVTWSMIQQWESFALGLKVVGQTEPTPGLPYIAALGSEVAVFFACIQAAISALSPADRVTLRLRGLVHIPAAAYLSEPTPPSPADLGFVGH